MTPQAIEELLKKDPFVPIRLTLSTEETVDITDPSTVFINNLALHVFGVKRRGSHIADWFRLVSLRHIVKIEQLESSAAA